MTWTWDGDDHAPANTVTTLMIPAVVEFADAASTVLRATRAPGDAVDLSVQWLTPSTRLSMDLRIRDEWTRLNGAAPAERLVENLADALTEHFGVALHRHRSHYADGRTCLSRSYISPQWAVSVTGWLPAAGEVA